MPVELEMIDPETMHQFSDRLKDYLLDSLDDTDSLEDGNAGLHWVDEGGFAGYLERL